MFFSDQKRNIFFSHSFFYFHWFSLFWKTHKLSTIFKRKYGYFLSFQKFFSLKDNFDSIKNFWWILQICIPFYHHPLSLDRISLFCYKMVKNLCLRLWIVVSKLQSSKNWWEKRIEKFEPSLSRIFSKDVLDLLLSASSRWNFVCLKQFRTELDVEYTDSIMVRCQETNWRLLTPTTMDDTTAWTEQYYQGYQGHKSSQSTDAF